MNHFQKMYPYMPINQLESDYVKNDEKVVKDVEKKVKPTKAKKEEVKDEQPKKRGRKKKTT